MLRVPEKTGGASNSTQLMGGCCCCELAWTLVCIFGTLRPARNYRVLKDYWIEHVSDPIQEGVIVKLKVIYVGLLGIAILSSCSSAMAQSWSMPKMFSSSQKKSNKSKPSSSTTQTLKKIDAGTKKFFRGTVDAITLKPLWDSSKKQKPRRSVDPWMRSTRKTAEKKPFWGSWFTPKEQPKKPATLGAWTGLARPK